METLTCSLASLQAGEQLCGTAPLVRTWLLLELNEPLTANALVENHLPEPVRSYLNEQQKSLPGSRLLLIQRSRKRRASGVKFFIGSSAESDPVLLEFSLQDYSELLNMDIAGLASSAPQNHEAKRAQPLYLVCTNGKRDACCAAHGAPFYRGLAALDSENTWQSSHVGGHRFAANAIFLPYGIYYGRLKAGQEREFLDACQERRLLAQHYRGRSIYPPHVQAAEYFLHQQFPELRLDELQLEHVEEVEPQAWRVLFRCQAGAALPSIQLRAGLSTYQVFENCGKAHELSHKTQYHRIA